MKPREKSAKSDAAKQKKQLMILGGLVVVLGIVMAIQFGGKKDDAAAEAATAPPSDPASVAQQLAGDPAAAAAAAGMPAPAAPAPAAPAAPPRAVSDNPVLSSPVEGEGLLRSPFAGFWNVTMPSGGGAAVSVGSDVAPPNMVLNATMPSAQHPLAVIDGEMHYVGDIIQGWQLTEIQARRILLTSPSRATVAVDMPLMPAAR